MTHAEIKEKMIWAGKVLVNEGQDDFTRGHISVSQPDALFYNAAGIYKDTINLIRSKEMGAGVARDLGPHSVVMLKNHGIVAAAATVEEVVIRAIMFEDAAQVQVLAEAAGDIAPEFPKADIEQLKHDISRPDQFAVNFDYLVRRAKRRER